MAAMAVLPVVSYPFLGIAYVPTHPQLIKTIGTSLVQSVGIGLAAAIPIFAFAWGIQARILGSILGPNIASMSLLGLSAPFWAAGFACAGEAALLAYAVVQYKLNSIRSRLFDEVLAIQQVKVVPVPPEELTEKRPAEKTAAAVKGSLVHRILSTVARGPVSMTSALTRPLLWAATLPLHFIPGLGSIAFCYLNGFAGAIDKHKPYFDKKRMSVAQREVWISKRETSYQRFGATATALELIPVFGVGLALTNTIGAALWAASLEKEWQAQHRGSVPAEGKTE